MTRSRNDLLDRIERDMPIHPDSFERLRTRRERKMMNRRVAGGVVGVGITLSLVSGIILAIRAESGRVDDVAQPDWAEVPHAPGPGEYYYVRFLWPGNGEVQLWLAADGSGRRLWRGGAGPTEVLFSSEEGTAEWLVTDLSNDSDEFLEQLSERSGPGGASPVPIATTSPGRSQEMTSVLRSMSDLLSFDSALMPGQIQALFGAAQQIDGVTMQVDVVDPWGRPAVSLSHVIDYPPSAASDLVWYFDPDTGQFLGEAWVNHRTGKVNAGTVVEMAGIVDSDHEVPAPNARFMPEPTDNG